MTGSSSVAHSTHTVQFHEGDSWLYQAIADFFSDALRNGSPAIMVCRRSTFEGVLKRLASQSDPVLADAAACLEFVDADETLRELMPDGELDQIVVEERFAEFAASLREGGGDQQAHIYGEMADLLSSQGRYDAALQLETTWNRMAVPGIATMCGYRLTDFDRDQDGSAFRAVCDAHTHVLHAPAPVITSPVYVVDDDESMRRSLVRLLESFDVSVQAFPSAEAFLADVDRASNGCLLLDIQLAGMSGIDLLTLMTAENWRMPVVAMSGLHDERREADALREGARAFLRKPFDADQLFTAIQRVQR